MVSPQANLCQEEDADMVLRFMASNRLGANLSKTTLLILNHKQGEDVTINVGGTLIKCPRQFRWPKMQQNNFASLSQYKNKNWKKTK